MERQTFENQINKLEFIKKKEIRSFCFHHELRARERDSEDSPLCEYKNDLDGIV